MIQRRVGVLFGEEKDSSGKAIAQALESLGHVVARIPVGPGLDQAVRRADIEVAFLALQGLVGEDGKVQGLLEVMGIPYTGSGVLASALAMNKGFSKKLFRQHNVSTPAGYVVAAHRLDEVEELHCDLGFPCVVKPASGDSSVGLSLVEDLDQLRPAVELACRSASEAVVERYVKGLEVTVAVLGGDVLGSCEYNGEGRTQVPPRLSRTRIENLEAMALTAYRALGCQGAARVDFICPEVGNEVLLEVNTLPELSPTSLLFQIARRAGLSFERLCERMLSLAISPLVPEILEIEVRARRV